ncbi:hypothetical protein FRB99_007210 [Tulasnella sp. 403]|nr:hypothetical protein FRB99_007210 [Tulasnella sp. 403]
MFKFSTLAVILVFVLSSVLAADPISTTRTATHHPSVATPSPDAHILPPMGVNSGLTDFGTANELQPVKVNTTIATPIPVVAEPARATWAVKDAVAYRALLAVNSISIVCCIFVLVGYELLRRWYPRIMKRLSLRLVACMAATDVVFHISNLIGYGNLPTDSIFCALFGGFFFACCSLTSLFYAAAIILNCQLVFVFAKRPSQEKEKYFVYGPPLLALMICLPTLVSGTYGYDVELEYCWYATAHTDPGLVLVKMIFTFAGWSFLVLLYLTVACTTIIRAVFSPHTQTLQISATVDGFAAPSQTVDVITRRTTAVRRLVIRLLGFVSVPIITIATGVTLDILCKTGTDIKPGLDGAFEVISGLAGTLNGILFVIDPAVLAIKEHKWYAIEEDEARPRPYTLSAWSSRMTDESVDVEKNIVQDARSRKFREIEQDLDGL